MAKRLDKPSEIEMMFRKMESLVDNNGRVDEGYAEAIDEINSIWPFSRIGELEEEIEELKQKVNRLESHRHDQVTGGPVVPL
jgi:hypothetical protein